MIFGVMLYMYSSKNPSDAEEIVSETGKMVCDVINLVTFEEVRYMQSCPALKKKEYQKTSEILHKAFKNRKVLTLEETFITAFEYDNKNVILIFIYIIILNL